MATDVTSVRRHAAELLVRHLGAALEGVIEDLVRGDLGSVQAVKQLWALIARERDMHGEYLARVGSNTGDAYWLMDGGSSAEEAIRYFLKENHQVLLDGISDLEIASFAPAFRGRLRAFHLASYHGRDSVKRLAGHIERGGRSLEEIIVSESASTADIVCPAGKIVSITSRRHRA